MLAVRSSSLRLLPAAQRLCLCPAATHLPAPGVARPARPAAQATNVTVHCLFGAASSGQQQLCQQPQSSASPLCLPRRQPHRGMRPNTDRTLMASAAAADASLATEQLCDGAVYCVGRNYVDHIKELPSLLDIPDELPSVPMIFLKSPSCIVRRDPHIHLPSWSADVQHEVELAVQLGPDLKPVVAAIALDLTARDIQAKAKRQGHPWCLSKSFAGSCPMGPGFATAGVDLQALELSIEVNGAVRQRSGTELMIFPVAQIVAYLAQRFPLAPGDWVLTGTPAGVGRLAPDDEVAASLRRPGGGGGGVLSEAAWRVVAGPEIDLDAWRHPDPWVAS